MWGPFASSARSTQRPTAPVTSSSYTPGGVVGGDEYQIELDVASRRTWSRHHACCRQDLPNPGADQSALPRVLRGDRRAPRVAAARDDCLQWRRGRHPHQGDAGRRRTLHRLGELCVSVGRPPVNASAVDGWFSVWSCGKARRPSTSTVWISRLTVPCSRPNGAFLQSPWSPPCCWQAGHRRWPPHSGMPRSADGGVRRGRPQGTPPSRRQ